MSGIINEISYVAYKMSNIEYKVLDILYPK